MILDESQKPKREDQAIVNVLSHLKCEKLL